MGNATASKPFIVFIGSTPSISFLLVNGFEAFHRLHRFYSSIEKKNGIPSQSSHACKDKEHLICQITGVHLRKK
jgi:hypothetical protein